MPNRNPLITNSYSAWRLGSRLTIAMGSLLLLSSQLTAAPYFSTAALTNIDIGSESKPALADLDGDGDLDVFIGKWEGTIRYFRNEGTPTRPNLVATPVSANPLREIDVGRRATPTFVDIDSDGDLDVFIGEWGGGIKFFRNEGTKTTPLFSAINHDNPFKGIDIGRYSSPTFVDIDDDGDMDVFIGGWRSHVEFFENIGSAQWPAFFQITDDKNPLDGVQIGSNIAPQFADIDGDGDMDAFIGEWNGRVKYFRNSGTVTEPHFTPAAGAANPLFRVNVRQAAAPAFGDIDLDGDLDVFIGEIYGTLHYLHNDGSVDSPDLIPTSRLVPLLSGVEASANVSINFADIDDDGDQDLFVSELGSSIRFFRNKGSQQNPEFIQILEKANPFDGILVTGSVAPTFIDIDSDGDLDVFIGEYDGAIRFFRNEGGPSAPLFKSIDGKKNPFYKIDIGDNAAPAFADLDNDGDFDLFVGERADKHQFFRNDGSATEPDFRALNDRENPFYKIKIGAKNTPIFGDIDLDGDMDLIVGHANGTLSYLKNLSSEEKSSGMPHFTLQSEPYTFDDGKGSPIHSLGAGNDTSPALVDIDGDGDLDLFVSASDGVIRLFENYDATPIAMDDATLVALNRAKITPNVLKNDLFKKEGPVADFSIADYEDETFNGGTVIKNSNDTFTYTPAEDYLGRDPFTYTLSNYNGSSATARVMLNVIIDTEPPRIIFPKRTTIAATSSDGVVITDPSVDALLATVIAKDNVDGLIKRVEHNAPEILPMGETVITFSVTDVSGNSVQMERSYTVADLHGPEITPPADLTLAATDSQGIASAEIDLKSFLEGVSAIDKIDGPITTIINSDIPETLLFGTTTVTFSATDAAGNTSTVSASITLLDQEPPTLTLPVESITIEAYDRFGLSARDAELAELFNAVSASDNVGVVSLKNDAPSNFPLGTTRVTFVAQDEAGNTAQAEISVKINGPKD